LASAVLIAFMAAALPIEAVASAADIMFLLLFIQVLVVLVALRKKRPDLPRGFKVPWVPLVPAVGIALQLFLALVLFFYSPMAWVSAGLWIGAGLAVFYGYARKRDRSYAQLVAVREAAERRDYRILACVGDSHHGATILRAAGAVARHYSGELVALSVVEVDERVLLAKGLNRVDQAREKLERALAGFRSDGVPVKSLVKISHRVSYGITETALEEKCNLIVMGRTRRVGLLDRLAATVVDRVVRSAPAQVMVVSAESWPERIGTILFPCEPGPHTALAADLAEAIAQVYQSRVRLLHVLPVRATVAQEAQARHRMAEALAGHQSPGELEIVRAGEVVRGIRREAQSADLIVIGGTEAGMLEQLLGYAPPLELAEQTSKPVITVYEMATAPRRWLR
jgi:nucleotide-binding universal stress UspA family protein